MAARAYELARRCLRDELGVEPSPSLQRLHREVLDQSVPLQGPRPGAPRPPAGAPPVGAGDRKTATRPASGSPPVAQHRASPPLVERRDAMARLHAVHDGLDALGGRVVVVRGEAGIGKTAVVRRFLHEIAGRADTLVGVCDDLGTSQPFAPVWDIARDVEDVARALADNDRRAVMDTLLDLLARPGHGTVLVFEDVQWADDATLDVVTFLGRRVTGTPGMLVLTYRDATVASDRALRATIGGLPGSALVRVDLAPLSPAGVAELVGDTPLDPGDVARSTGGNPFFVRELVASGLSGDLPTSVRDVVLARLARLPDDARNLVRTLSVLPGGGDWRLLEDLGHFAPPALDAAVAAELVVADDERITFRHELQRRAVLNALPVPVRRRRHRAVLAALGDDADAATVVHHAVRADDDALVRETVPDAARAALREGRRRDALTLFRLLRGQLDSYPTTAVVALAEDWAHAAWHFDVHEALDLMQMAIDLHRRAADPAALARALAFGAYVLASCGRASQGQAWAAEAVELLQADGSSPDYAFALAEQTRLLANLADDDREARVVARRAVEVADAIGDSQHASSALAHEGVLLLRAGEQAGLQCLERARATAAAAGHPYEEADAMMLLAGQTRRHDPALAAELLDGAQEIAAEHEFDGLRDFVQAQRAAGAAQRSEWTVAERLATPITDADATPRALAWQVLATIDSRRGAAAAAAVVDHAWSVAQQVGLPYQVEASAAVVAEHLWTSGRRDPALLDRLDQVLDAGVRAGAPHRPFSAFAMAMWLLGRLSIVPASLSSATRAIVDGDAQRAIADRSRHGASIPLAFALLHGKDDQAVQAVRMFDDLGAHGIAARARAVTAARGVAAPPAPHRERGGPGQPLDPRGAEILSLLAQGAEDDEIGRVLLLTPDMVPDKVLLLLRHLDVPDVPAAVDVARRTAAASNEA